MSTHVERLAVRRAALLARSAQLRDRLAFDASELHAALSPLERGVAIGRSAARRPLLLLGALALLLVLRPGRLLRLGTRIAVVYPLARRLLPQVVRGVRIALQLRRWARARSST